MITPAIRAHIASKLTAVAAENGVRVLYAAESGSRAWGFGSPDSDYDVRFVYAHPREWYVSLHERRDVIERPLDEHLVDLAGWDVRKALRLMLRSNPAFYEWLVSPIVYVDDGMFAAEAKRLFEVHASPKALAHHYWSIARGQWKREIEGTAEVRLKKYFYVIRPLLSLAHVIEYGTPPPMSIDALLTTSDLPEAVSREIAQLIAVKRNTPELGRGPHIATLDDWVQAEFAARDPAKLQLSDRPRIDARQAADDFFRRTIGLRST